MPWDAGAGHVELTVACADSLVELTIEKDCCTSQGMLNLILASSTSEGSLLRSGTAGPPLPYGQLITFYSIMLSLPGLGLVEMGPAYMLANDVAAQIRSYVKAPHSEGVKLSLGLPEMLCSFLRGLHWASSTSALPMLTLAVIKCFILQVRALAHATILTPI